MLGLESGLGLGLGLGLEREVLEIYEEREREGY